MVRSLTVFDAQYNGQNRFPALVGGKISRITHDEIAGRNISTEHHYSSEAGTRKMRSLCPTAPSGGRYRVSAILEPPKTANNFDMVDLNTEHALHTNR
jgi:hypothetical protein